MILMGLLLVFLLGSRIKILIKVQVILTYTFHYFEFQYKDLNLIFPFWWMILMHY